MKNFRKNTDAQHMLPAHIPWYRRSMFWLLLHVLIYAGVSVLIVNNIYPGELSILSGLLMPGLFFSQFFSELTALLISGLLLALITKILAASSRKALLITVIGYYSLTIILALLYMAAFN